MKVVVVNGNMRKGSTWHCKEMIIKEIMKHEPVVVIEYSLPKDMPHYCLGCFTCFTNGEGNCPHSEFIKPIVDSIISADVIVLTSPVYGMDVSGQMKAFLDHLCYMWMSHRPDPNMFDKVGLTISTTAGAGLVHTTKTLKNSLKFWGVKKVFSIKAPVSAMRWEDVSEDRKAKINKQSVKIAAKIIKSVRDIDSVHNPLFRTIFFNMMKRMQRNNDWNTTDREHWEKNGWINGTSPF